MNWAISERRLYGDDFCVGVAGIGDWRMADVIMAALLGGEPEIVRACRCHRSRAWREGVADFCACGGGCWGRWMRGSWGLA